MVECKTLRPVDNFRFRDYMADKTFLPYSVLEGPSTEAPLDFFEQVAFENHLVALAQSMSHEKKQSAPPELECPLAADAVQHDHLPGLCMEESDMLLDIAFQVDDEHTTNTGGKLIKTESRIRDLSYRENKKSFRIKQENNDKKMRTNSWTAREEIFLWGILVMKYLHQGTLFNPINKELGGNAYDQCFMIVKKAYDIVQSNYLLQNPSAAPSCRRTWQALARHYKVMKSNYSKENDGEKFYTLYEEWRAVYNKNYTLFNPSYFEDKCYCPDLEKVYEKQIQSRQIFKRANSWGNEEEIILVGAVMDRFLRRGSLTSPRRISKSTECNDHDGDCWESVKQSYDIAWERYTDITGNVPKERTVNALSRHFKVMKQRIIDSQGKEKLLDFYERWRKEYNINGRLLQSYELETTSIQTSLDSIDENNEHKRKRSIKVKEESRHWNSPNVHKRRRIELNNSDYESPELLSEL